MKDPLFPLLLKGLTIAGILNLLVAKSDWKAFETVASQYPNVDRDVLRKFWLKARSRKLEEYEDGLKATMMLDAAEGELSAIRRFKKAIANVHDRTCAPQVAAWILADAAQNFFDLGHVGLSRLTSGDTDELVAFIKGARAGRTPRLQLVYDDNDAGTELAS